MPAAKRKTVIVVANGTTARGYVNTGVGKGLDPAPLFDIAIDNPPTRDQGSERPGRVHDRFGPGRHAMEPKADWHRQDKAAFARTLAERLETAARDGAADRFVLVAPPTMMGDLRGALSPHVRDLVSGEITKDLTHCGLSELEGQVGGVLAV